MKKPYWLLNDYVPMLKSESCQKRQGYFFLEIKSIKHSIKTDMLARGSLL